MKLSQLGEFELIKKLGEKCPDKSSDVLTGIGDDAAVVKNKNNKSLITSDMLIEGVHFDLSFTTFYQLGFKFLAVNVSDILAMGGSPRYFLISMGIPKNFSSDDIYELYSGIKNMAKKFGVAVIGGDTCTSKSGLILSGTLIGAAKKVITRSGAQAGDGIFITDTVGDSAMGLHLLKKRKKRIHRFSPANPSLNLIKKHLMPRLSPLKSTASITSMIDVSDGLLIDLSHICDESKTGALLYKEKVPLSKELRTTAQSMKTDPHMFAFKGGEDYCLLFTAPSNYRTAAFKIGEITKRGRYIVDSNGRKTKFGAEGYEHFKDSSQ
jgi:thiamine-monophosphate kinase